jgi:hypothetical protein
MVSLWKIRQRGLVTVSSCSWCTCRRMHIAFKLFAVGLEIMVTSYSNWKTSGRTSTEAEDDDEHQEVRYIDRHRHMCLVWMPMKKKRKRTTEKQKNDKEKTKSQCINARRKASEVERMYVMWCSIRLTRQDTLVKILLTRLDKTRVSCLVLTNVYFHNVAVYA